MSARISEVPPSSGAASGAPPRRRKWLERAASIGTSAQAAIPGAYAWSITVAPAAWSFWGFVVSSVLVWLLVPSALSPVRLDGLRGGLGMVGWALFAFASAGPV